VAPTPANKVPSFRRKSDGENPFLKRYRYIYAKDEKGHLDWFMNVFLVMILKKKKDISIYIFFFLKDSFCFAKQFKTLRSLSRGGSYT